MNFRILFLTALSINQLLADPHIEIDTCYGNAKKLIVEGRLYESRSDTKVSKSDSLVENIKNSFGYIFNDELKEHSLDITINGNIYRRESDDEGYFSLELSKSHDEFVPDQKILVSLEQNISKSCKALIVDKKPKIGIISDFDDTVVISNVTNKLKLAKNLLLKNYRQRVAVKDMKERFLKILDPKDPILFFVTGSPKQLQKPIEKFLDLHKFPKRVVIAKKLHGNYADALFDQLEYKYKKIKDLILLYPNVTWVLFGDSGEKDRDVYTKIKREYPKKIKEIYIRDVKSGIIKQI